jgi:hypothetical protein
MTRVVSHKFTSAKDLESETSDLLDRELTIDGTTVTQYGTDGLFLWMNGAPGPNLREVVKKLKELGWKPITNG